MAKGRIRDVVVLLPGITGSVLQKDGVDVWAPSGKAIARTLFSLGDTLKELSLGDDDPDIDDIGDGIRATRLVSDAHLVPGLVKIDEYSSLSRLITERFKVVPGHPHQSKPANFFEFPYDWRRDNRVAARGLKRPIDDQLPKWREFSGAHDAKVILLAHSMGGLVSRHYLECLEGWRDCRALIGDAKMASLATRSAIAAMGDQYLTRLPKSSKQEERDQWINRALSDEASLDAIGAGDEPFGHGYELAREMTDGSTVWNERVLVYRSEAVAQRQRNGLAQRIESAIAALNALTPPIGRGRRQHATLEQLNAAIRRIERKHKVEGLLCTRWRSEPWPSRALPDRERFIVIDVIVSEAKVEHLSQRLGWQVLVTNVPLDSLPLTEAVPLYNEGWRIEMQFRDIKNRPLGIRPLLVTRDDQIVGLTHLIILALRLMTLITTLVRRSLKASGATLVGLIDGQKSRATDRPTARRLHKAFHRHQITVTRIRGPGQELDHITLLPPLLSQILQHLGFSDRLYTDLPTLGAN